jgi:hypothetical protein
VLCEKLPARGMRRAGPTRLAAARVLARVVQRDAPPAVTAGEDRSPEQPGPRPAAVDPWAGTRPILPHDDADNRIATIAGVGSYAYDASGGRVKKSEAGVSTYTWFPGYQEEWADGAETGKVLRYYYARRSGGVPLCGQGRASAVTWLSGKVGEGTRRHSACAG